MNWQNYIVSDKEVLLGKPTIKGTRISVEHLIGLYAQGWTEGRFLMEKIPLRPLRTLRLTSPDGGGKSAAGRSLARYWWPLLKRPPHLRRWAVGRQARWAR